MPERQRGPVLPLAAAAAATTSIDIGAGVLVALARNPMSVAVTAHVVQVISRGRLILGLGPQFPVHLARRSAMPADHPVPRMREFVAALRAIWDCWNHAEPPDFHGRFYSHALETPVSALPPNHFDPPKIFLSATETDMAELAGQVADGLIAPPCASSRHLAEFLLPAVERGLAAADRPRESFTVMCGPLIAAESRDTEHAIAVERIRRQVATFISAPTYRSMLELHGLGGLSDELTALRVSGDSGKWQRASTLIDDSILELFAITAPPHELGNAISRRFGGLADRVSLPAAYAGYLATSR